ncbi:hypothetical protein DSCO28_09220 [Desulfosarcina ovata subsp. sediminis]|uniref:Uncharacterized protein n=1 Tax=Desulfosarcina ovata subsp. sediminis TaxID=885957 RepID=A0A5K7ZHA3_9BACT|nr:hypothetical protein DSCO28_09220 [Desulfosarcina ovata subsp. sediminis]
MIRKTINPSIGFCISACKSGTWDSGGISFEMGLDKTKKNDKLLFLMGDISLRANTRKSDGSPGA